MDQVAARLGWQPLTVSRGVKFLLQRGLAEENAGVITLTDRGRDHLEILDTIRETVRNLPLHVRRREHRDA